MEDFETREAKAALYTDTRLRKTRAYLESKHASAAPLQKRERVADVEPEKPTKRTKRLRRSNSGERTRASSFGASVGIKARRATNASARRPVNAASVVANMFSTRASAKNATFAAKNRAVAHWDSPVRSAFGSLFSSWGRRAPKHDAAADSKRKELELVRLDAPSSLAASLTSLSLHDVQRYKRDQQGPA